jgi:ectoine hydroxylase-related dioxygenase (phytanoyl-CoA dioxygenase family)
VVKDSSRTGATFHQDDNRPQHRALNIVRNQRWKDRISGRVVIPYTLSTSFSSTDADNIRSALVELEMRTGSLWFVQRSNEGSYIKVVREEEDRCFSRGIGKQGGPQILNLRPNCMSKGEHAVWHQ